MPERRFIVECAPEEARYRVEFLAEKGQVQRFVVHLEYRVGNEWQPVVRYDTAHGEAHCDSFAPDGSVSPHQPLGIADYNQALTHAQETVRNHWREFIRPFQEALP